MNILVLCLQVSTVLLTKIRKNNCSIYYHFTNTITTFSLFFRNIFHNFKPYLWRPPNTV